MNVKEYLNQARCLNELIRSNEKEIADLRLSLSSISGIDYSKDRVQTTKQNDASFVNLIAKILEFEDVIKADIEKLLSLKLEIRNVIDSVKDNEQRLILRCRYLNCMKWDEICEEIGVSDRTAHRIHKNALENIKLDGC